MLKEEDQGDSDKLNEAIERCDTAKADADSNGAAPPDCWKWRTEQESQEPIPPNPPSKKQVDLKCGKRQRLPRQRNPNVGVASWGLCLFLTPRGSRRKPHRPWEHGLARLRHRPANR